MYVQCKFHRLTRTGTEAKFLGELWTCRTILLQSTPDSVSGVRGLYGRTGGLPKKAALCFCCEGRSVLLRTERALRISIDCSYTALSGHLELEVGLVRHRIEFSECGSSEQCMITTAERDDIKD